jgi:hypothetical protein
VSLTLQCDVDHTELKFFDQPRSKPRRARRSRNAPSATDRSLLCGCDALTACASATRLDPNQFAGHLLRAGFLTSAASRGASIFKMMDVSHHRSVDTLRGYVRDAEIFKDHAGAGLL